MGITRLKEEELPDLVLFNKRFLQRPHLVSNVGVVVLHRRRRSRLRAMSFPGEYR